MNKIVEYATFRTLVKLVFQIGCIILAGILGLEQFNQYSKNLDSTSVSYRKFNQAPVDAYPTYTVCIKSFFGDIFQKDKFLGLEGYPNSLVYNYVLRGICCNNQSIVEKAAPIDFDSKLAFDIRNFVIEKMTITREGNEINSWSNETNNITEMNTFYRSYQDPNRVCLTNTIDFKENLILKRDFLNLNTIKMKDALRVWENNLQIEFFLHQPGASISMLHDPILRIDRLQLEYLQNTSRMVTLRVNQVDVLEKREDAIPPCNASLIDLDAKYRQSVVEFVGCGPSYWKRFFKTDFIKNLKTCNSKDEFLTLSKYMPLYFENGTKLFRPNCRQMTITFDMSQADLSYSQGRLGFLLSYGSENYKHFLNVRSISINDMWSQIGGFIGMLLGYSLLQTPEIFIYVVMVLRHHFSKKPLKLGSRKAKIKNEVLVPKKIITKNKYIIGKKEDRRRW